MVASARVFPKHVHVTAAGVTDRGRVRHENQDSFVVAELDSSDSVPAFDGMLGRNGLLLAVADGMGGAEGGGLASMVAVGALEATLKETATGCDSKALPRAMSEANEAVCEAGAQLELDGMGTTLTAVHLCGTSATIAHVGDSRAYVVRDGDLVQLTRDDTVVQAAVEAGDLTPSEARVSPIANLLLSVMGTERRVDMSTSRLQLRRGDVLLLCSDGLTGLVDDETIRDEILRARPLAETAQTLVDRANAAGGRDNVTVVLAHVDGDIPEASGDEAIEDTFEVREIPPFTPEVLHRCRSLLHQARRRGLFRAAK